MNQHLCESKIHNWITQLSKINFSKLQDKIDTTNVNYRLVQIEDIAAMQTINANAETVNFQFSFYVKFAVENPDLSFTAIDANGELAGYILCNIIEEKNNRKYAHISALTVAQIYRGSDVALKLIQNFENAVHRKNLKIYDLYVSETNARAMRFYEKIGCRNFQKLIDYYGPGEHAIQYIKTI